MYSYSYTYMYRHRYIKQGNKLYIYIHRYVQRAMVKIYMYICLYM